MRYNPDLGACAPCCFVKDLFSPSIRQSLCSLNVQDGRSKQPDQAAKAACRARDVEGLLFLGFGLPGKEAGFVKSLMKDSDNVVGSSKQTG